MVDNYLHHKSGNYSVGHVQVQNEEELKETLQTKHSTLIACP